MIERHYFMCAEKVSNGSSVSGHYVTLSLTSWLAKPVKAFEESRTFLMEKMNVTDLDRVKIVAFNRI